MTEISDDIVKLLDEEGQEHSFVVLNIIKVKENKYAIMIPLKDELSDELSELDEQEAIVFRIDDNDGEQMLTVVEEGEEWEAVANAWEEMSIDDEDDDDDEDNEDEEDDEEDDEDNEDDEDDEDEEDDEDDEDDEK